MCHRGRGGWGVVGGGGGTNPSVLILHYSKITNNEIKIILNKYKFKYVKSKLITRYNPFVDFTP